MIGFPPLPYYNNNMGRERKKSWNEKVKMAKESCLRAQANSNFGQIFYKNLFFLKPTLKNYFSRTDFEHQHKALINGLNFLFGYLDKSDSNSSVQLLRLAKTHAHNNLNIHPHEYYYWSEALILSIKNCDNLWHNDLEYYLRETSSYALAFMISQYFISD